MVFDRARVFRVRRERVCEINETTRRGTGELFVRGVESDVLILADGDSQQTIPIRFHRIAVHESEQRVAFGVACGGKVSRRSKPNTVRRLDALGIALGGAREGRSIPARMAMMATTAGSSMSCEGGRPAGRDGEARSPASVETRDRPPPLPCLAGRG